MLEKRVKHKIYNRLQMLANGISDEIGFMTERLGIVETILLLYYLDNEGVLNSKKYFEDEDEE